MWCCSCGCCAACAAWYCGHGHSCCAMFGVAVAVVMLCMVLRVLSSCCIWCCGCHHHTTYGLMCAVIVPHWCCSFCHRAIHGVAGTVIVLCLVLQLLSSLCTSCCGHGRCHCAAWCCSRICCTAWCHSHGRCTIWCHCCGGCRHTM